ncbi:hypothetical protein STW0522RAO56_47680 [Raoultella planticola]|nr:hypothetical protein STW0522RAO56_47680 [Raoultella planticola]
MGRCSADASFYFSQFRRVSLFISPAAQERSHFSLLSGQPGKYAQITSWGEGELSYAVYYGRYFNYPLFKIHYMV